MRTIYLNGEYMPEDKAAISPFDRGFLFADAVYEVISVVDGRLVDFDRHIARLSRSLQELSIADTLPASDWLVVFRELVASNSLVEGMIYLQVTRGNPGDRSFYWPSAEVEPTIFACTQAASLTENPVAETGLSIVTLPDLRWGRADIKTTQLLYASMMKMEAKARGADDAWLVRDNVVTEGTSQNAHIVTQEGVLVSHPLNRTILHGVTRAAMVDLLAGEGITLEERAFTVEEAELAKEAFVSSASLFIMPVTSVNGKKIGNGMPGAVSMTLRKAYIDWAKDNAA
jgi:D-alanine transaminase